MIGFVVSKLDINVNTECINTLAATKISCNVIRGVQKEDFIPHFEYHYSSVHEDSENNTFTLYHLMFDYSNNIDPASSRDKKKPVNNPTTRTTP
jgi:hypothetical protein